MSSIYETFLQDSFITMMVIPLIMSAYYAYKAYPYTSSKQFEKSDPKLADDIRSDKQWSRMAHVTWIGIPIFLVLLLQLLIWLGSNLNEMSRVWDASF